MKAVKFTVILFVSMIFGKADGLCAQEIQNDAQKIFEQFNNTMSTLPKVFAIEAESNVEMEGTLAGMRKQRQWAQFKYFGDSGQLDVGYTNFDIDDKGEYAPDTMYNNRAIINKTGQMFVYFGKDVTPKEVVYTEHGEDKVPFIRAQLAGGEALDGFLDRDQMSIVELLSKAEDLRLRKDLEVVDGFKCYVLEGTTNHGKYAIWLDPESGYLPRKATIKKTGDDIFDHIPLSQILLPDLPSISEVSFVMDSVQIENINGVSVPVGCHTTEVRQYANGKTVTTNVEHKRTNVNLSPDFESLGAFRPDIPDGTIINNQDFVDTGIKFEWRNGEVVTHIGNSYLRAVDAVVADMKSANVVKAVESFVTTPPKEASTNITGPNQVGKTHSDNKVKEAPVATLSSGTIFLVIGLLSVLTAAGFVISYLRKSKHA